jgi:hypothetical protein
LLSAAPLPPIVVEIVASGILLFVSRPGLLGIPGCYDVRPGGC